MNRILSWDQGQWLTVLVEASTGYPSFPTPTVDEAIKLAARWHERWNFAPVPVPWENASAAERLWVRSLFDNVAREAAESLHCFQEESHGHS